MSSLIERLGAIVGAGGLLTGEEVAARSDTWPPQGGLQARAVVRPANTAEVSEVLKICHAAGQTVVTHGGITGLAGGAISTKDDVVLSLERMRAIEPVDTYNRTVQVEAGVALQTVQEKAEAADLLFALDFGARGSAQIGGVLATNAGGNSVIRYGMAREQVLGLEAVLADGTVISSMKCVIKNNTGYDLKQLFIGSEGTLGVITRAVLRLRPLARSKQTALVAIDDFDRLSRFLQTMDAALGGTLSTFEVMWNDFYSAIVGDGSRHGRPLDSNHAFYVLVESTGGHQESDAMQFESAMGEAFESGLLADAVIAQSRQQASDLWAIRDDIEGLFKYIYPPIVFDVSLGIRDIDAYVQEIRDQIAQRWPGFKMVTFGHLGDGNIHLGISIGSSAAEDIHQVEETVYTALGSRQGVISAEHGIGLAKRAFLQHSRSPEEIELMRTMKRALDPANLLNPGKIFEM